MLSLPGIHASWIELRTFPDSRARLYHGATSVLELNLTFNALRGAVPGLQLGRTLTCAGYPRWSDPSYLLRADVRQRTHSVPFAGDLTSGEADLRLQSLVLPSFGGARQRRRSGAPRFESCAGPARPGRRATVTLPYGRPRPKLNPEVARRSRSSASPFSVSR